MKKTLVAIAAVASAAGAMAQSSVTISGQVMYGMSRTAGHANSVGGPKGDRNYLSFAAAEDLGGGLKAGALLQNRFMPADGGQTTSYVNSATGTVEAQMWEQSMAYISDAKLGEVKMGRFSNQLVSVNGIGHYQEDWASGTHSGTQYGRVSGQVQYTSPTYAGVQGFALHAKGDNNAYWINNGNGYKGVNAIGTGASYAAGAGVATMKSDLSLFGANYTNGGLAVQLATLNGFNGEKDQFINVGYDFGVAKVALNQFQQKDNVAFMMAHKSTELGVSVPVGKWTLAVTKLTNDVNVGSTTMGTALADTKRDVTGVYAKYALSKRTFFEFYGSKTKNAYSSAGARDAAADGLATYVGMAHGF